ncbi:protein of unknown function [Cupriavidus taiwanensis]|uniref:Uncharacterized protein n=1 Tax=Cupriavidus taiwanensis TaxID=164546 RepID=A0A375IEY1_9BURK|nr:hypothetical protein CBM2592_A110041 [Cupriavidus taiwanensis]SOY58844.1 hypothetical protein CBM2588_A80042 [Cupriavidus taiwanensis]SOY80079.1 hypothetical protein CBM2591_A120042 [Cupriavidus taiwanensis]SOZ50822.1 hypothetical protein CBM2617_A110041 [Cupriavidus taiwanensis]SOZ75966.1 hypothetical protein CBM2622_A110041 [Cupriavidus taiwanensis]
MRQTAGDEMPGSKLQRRSGAANCARRGRAGPGAVLQSGAPLAHCKAADSHRPGTPAFPRFPHFFDPRPA